MHAHQLRRSLVCAELGARRHEWVAGVLEEGARGHKAGFPFNLGSNPCSAPSWLWDISEHQSSKMGMLIVTLVSKS